MLESKPGILVVSFLLALFMFLGANKVFEDFTLFESDSNLDTVTIENVPVDIKHDEDNFYITGAQKHVQVDLSGSPSKLKRIQTTKNFSVKMDLNDYSPGEYEVSYEIEGLPEDITGEVLPERSTVSVQNLVEQTFEVSAELNESRVGSNYSIEDIDIDPKTVTVRGGEEDMERIQYVRAMISGEEKITDSESENSEISVFDSEYNKLDVVVEPKNVSVKIDVTENQKEVPVDLDLVGELKDNYHLDDAQLEKETVVLYGSDEALDEVYQVTAELDLDTISKSGKRETKLNIPDNITRAEPSSIKADIKISK